MDLARRRATTPATELAGYAAKLEALRWELRADLEAHQIDRLQAPADEMRLSSLP